MDRRRWTTVAVVLAVLLAGCAGFSSDTSQPAEPTATTTPQPSEPTATPTASVESSPAGWNASGVQNATAAINSHYRAVLTGPSATVTYRSRVVTSTDDRAANTTLDMRLAPGERRLYASIDGGEQHRIAFLAGGTMSVWSVQNETVVGQSDASFVRQAQSIDRRVLKSQLLLYKLERTDVVRRNGTDALVYTVTGVYNNTVSQTHGSATSATGHVVVSERGRVLEIETTVTYTRSTVRYTYTQTRLGATEVPTPDWAPQA